MKAFILPILETKINYFFVLFFFGYQISIDKSKINSVSATAPVG